MNNFSRSVFLIFILVARFSFAADTCSPFQSVIDETVHKQLRNIKIVGELDLAGGGASDEFSKSKSQDPPGCVCAKLDGKKDFCALIVIPTDVKLKTGATVYLLNVGSKDSVLKKIHSYPWSEDGKSAVYIQQKLKTTLVTRGKPKQTSVVMPNDGIEIADPRKSSLIIFYEKNKLKKIWMAN